MTLISSILLLVPAVLQGWLTIILFQRRLYRPLGCFFVYTLFASIAGLVKFAVQRTYRVYFVTYWATEAIYAILGLLAILEIFPFVFKSFSRTQAFRLATCAVMVLMIALSIIHAVLSPPIQAGRIIAAIYSLEIGVQYTQGGIFVLFFLMAMFYKVPWRRYAFGVVFGFGLLAAGSLAAALLRSEFGTRFKFLFTYMPGVVYVLAVLVWVLTFLKPEPPDPLDGIESPLSPEQAVGRLRKMSAVLKGRRDDTNLLASTHLHISGPPVPFHSTSSGNSTAYDHRGHQVSSHRKS